MPARRRYCRWALAACLVLVLILALVPPPTYLPSTSWDKANHALVFAVLAVLGCHSFPGRVPRVLLGLLAYGAAIEVLQGFTGYRDAAWLDLLADGVGLAFGGAMTLSKYLRPRVDGRDTLAAEARAARPRRRS